MIVFDCHRWEIFVETRLVVVLGNVEIPSS